MLGLKYIQGIELGFTWINELQLKITSRQKLLEEKLYLQIASNFSKKISKKDLTKLFTVPIFTENVISFDCKMNDQIIKPVENKDVFGVVLTKKINNLTVYFGTTDSSEEFEEIEDESEKVKVLQIESSKIELSLFHQTTNTSKITNMELLL